VNTDEFIEAVDEMDAETVACNFEALMALALAIEEKEATDEQ
jgi:hypothetical protein